MLMLERKPGEKIIIDGNIVITVQRWDEKYQCIYLGFEAPREITIDRMEIHHKRTSPDWRNNG